MKGTHKRWGLGAALVLAAGSMLATATPIAASAAAAPKSPNACAANPRINDKSSHKIVGVVPAVGNCPAASAAGFAGLADFINPSDPAKGTPPLLYHGGPVMMTAQTGPLDITPIYWNPSDHPMSLLYKTIINEYVSQVAKASGQNTNVFSVVNEYHGTNGEVSYNVTAGNSINDTDPLPASGCQVAGTDTSGIYADGSGYDSCLDDVQLQAEINNVTAAAGLPHNLSHIYVLYLPKHVESCVLPGSTTTSANNCTINYQPSATYCAYHSDATSGAIYANMPYPIYNSKTGFSCGTEFNFGSIQSPNGMPDADVEISPSSHEINEAITDPDTVTGWYDSSGFEIGDECAYVFGAVQGTAGRFWNQTIGAFHYLTQEEFSNNDFAVTGGGCVQASKDES